MLPAAGCRAGATSVPSVSSSGRRSAAEAAPRSRQHAQCAPPQQQWWQQPWQQQRRRDWAVGITNTQEEFKRCEGTMPEDDDYVEVSRLQIPNPELGPLEQRVEATYESATLSDSISIEDTEYWFNTPEGGWNIEPERVAKAKETTTEIPTAHNPGDGRAALDTVVEGAELTGVVTRMMLYHGAQVDLGTVYDGLIPVQRDEWKEEVNEALWIDEKVSVRVHKVRDPGLYRWPIQLELLAPANVAKELPPPEVHRPALDLRGRGDLDELIEATGRPYRTYNYYAPTESPPFDGGEDEDEGSSPQDLWAPSVLSRITDIACSL